MPRIFISYSHDSPEHRQRVFELAQRLRDDQLEVLLDYDQERAGGPLEGWDIWSEKQVQEADRVLIVVTPTYKQRYDFKGAPGKGLGVVSEAGVIRQLLYNEQGLNPRFRVVLLDPTPDDGVPLTLQRFHRYSLYENYAALIQWLRGAAAGPVGIRWPAPDSSYRWPLADRKKEFEFFERMLTGREPKRVLLLEGKSNCGKSEMLRQLRQYAELLRVPVSLVNFQGSAQLDDLYYQLKVDLTSKLLPEAARATGPGRFYGIISDLQSITQPVLLLFDTYQQAVQDARDWLEHQFLRRLSQSPAVVVVMAGQDLSKIQKQSWSDLAEQRTLGGIQSPDDWLEYARVQLNYSSMPVDKIKTLIDALDGEPGSMIPALRNLVAKLAIAAP